MLKLGSAETLNPRKRKTEDTEKESLDSESILKGLETQETSLRELRTILFNNLLQLQVGFTHYCLPC